MNSFIISPLLELSKGRQLLYGIMVAFDQCVYIDCLNHVELIDELKFTVNMMHSTTKMLELYLKPGKYILVTI